MAHRPQPTRIEAKLDRKIPVLFTSAEHAEIVRMAAADDRPACNFVHWVTREYLAGRLVPTEAAK